MRVIIHRIHEKKKYASGNAGSSLKHNKEIEYKHKSVVQYTGVCGKKVCSFVVNFITLFQRFCITFGFPNKEKKVFDSLRFS